ncbi:MAG: 30S ribosomal protein S7 [Gammaproteobacteria bacterium]|nr:30S ribosomal protein S7 [Gammaproteobacteria bacterium]
MSRRREAAKREILPDPLYNSLLVAQFINRIMRSGKKSIAEKIVYGAFENLKETKAKNDHVVDFFDKALDNVRPTVEVKSRRVGGATYQVPVEVRNDRQTALAMRWIVEAAKARSEKTMALRLAAELKDATDNRGTAVKKREDMHRAAKANQAFAHFRW